MNFQTKDRYHVRIVSKSECSFEGCNHGCHHVIQLVNRKTDQMELEFCEIEAEKIAGILLHAVDRCAKTMS